MMSSARAVYDQKILLVKKKASIAIVSSALGVIVAYTSEAYSFLAPSGNTFLLAISYYATNNLYIWGFILTVAGALMAKWHVDLTVASK